MHLVDLVVVVGETLDFTARFGISVVLAVAVLALAVAACESAGMGDSISGGMSFGNRVYGTNLAARRRGVARARSGKRMVEF